MQCEADGTPTPKILWSKDGLAVESTNRIYLSAENTELHIEHSKESDSGTYIYFEFISIDFVRASACKF